MSREKRHIVTFELPEVVYQALVEEATIRGVASRHQRAREILIEHFADRSLDDRLAELLSEVLYLGELIRRDAYSGLVHAAARTSDEANEWIRTHMPRTTG